MRRSHRSIRSIVAASVGPLAISLVLGAVITVAIAVGLALLPVGRTFDYGDPSPRDLRFWSRVVPADFPNEPTTHPTAVVGIGYRTRQFWTEPPAVPRSHVFYLVQSWWPLLCLEGAVTQDSVNPPRRWTILGELGGRIRFVPLGPIGPAFAANTGIYSLLLLGGWMGGRGLFRMRRRQRGCCVECGYRLEHASICPECGTPRHPLSHEASSRRAIRSRD